MLNRQTNAVVFLNIINTEQGLKIMTAAIITSVILTISKQTVVIELLYSQSYILALFECM